MIISENIVEILSRYLLTVNNYNRFFFKNIKTVFFVRHSVLGMDLYVTF